MKFTFLGGSSEIGSTALLLQTDEFSSIFDYGLTPASPPEYPLETPPLDYIFLSHAHLDHCGMIPTLTRKYPVPFFTSQMTLLISQLLLRDNLKICEYEGYPIMYSKADISAMDRDLQLIAENSQISLNQSELYSHSAGHIPGALMFKIKLKDGRTVLFTGDINTIDTQLVLGTKSEKCDILVMEATYSSSNHELRQKIEHRFLEKIEEVLDRGGKVIVPAFAVGRTQEILLVLSNMVGDLNIWLDGMGKDVTKLFLREPGFIRNEKKLKKIYEKVNKVRSKAHRKKALNADVILTTSGMLDGGPVLNYINQFKDNEKNAVLLTGYQVEGSNGRRLIDKGEINLYGTAQKIKLEVQHFDFSAHSGHNELVNFAHRCDPEHVILFHSDNREPLQQELSENYQVHLPMDGKTFEL